MLAKMNSLLIKNIIQFPQAKFAASQQSIRPLINTQNVGHEVSQRTKMSYKYKLGLKIYNGGFSQSLQQSGEKQVLLVKRKGNQNYELPTIELNLDKDHKQNLNEAKMNLFNNLSQNKWKVFFTSLEPNQVIKEKSSQPNDMTKTLIFEAVKFNNSTPCINKEIYDSYKWESINHS